MYADTTVDQQQLEASIKQARTRLEGFEKSTTSRELLARLRASSPMHPVLMVRSLAGFSSVGCVAGALTVLAIPLISRDLASRIADFEGAVGIPVPAILAMLAACAFVTALGAQFAAMSIARSSPYLPHEAKAHQRLVSDLQQLEAQRAVKERMTPRPATPRMIASR